MKLSFELVTAIFPIVRVSLTCFVSLSPDLRFSISLPSLGTIQLAISKWLYFWTFNSIPWICALCLVSVLVSTPCYLDYYCFPISFFFFNFTYWFEREGWGGERESETVRERETLICCSTCLCIHWLLLVRVLIGDWTCNLGASRWCSNQLSNQPGPAASFDTNKRVSSNFIFVFQNFLGYLCPLQLHP